ncbi:MULTISPECIES: SDR family NAD(P)-dependent oxidoreductase [unclassified Pseudoalteromonas]|uniref:SDR family NAD(P)-dependent oxidoreductase n=1 Tax=unclassified Pseudoalteromonas TaxID=194690 RepID=UPI000491BFC3|nr:MULTISPECIES: SDR family oxidoreductase [unclassified Pseudoalteromonas]
MRDCLFSLQGKSVLVTGAAGHLGREICFGLAESGANVLVNSRSKKKAQKLVEQLTQKGFSAELAVFDVTLKNQVDAFFTGYTGKLHVIINNAYTGAGGTIETSTAKQYTFAYSITLESAHYLFQHSLPYLRAAVKECGYASVINIASMYGKVSPDLRLYSSAEGTNPPFYGVAKAALIQWTKYGACEFGREGIRFNSISPGPFPNLCTNDSEFIESLVKKVPLNRVGLAAELKGPVIFLASSASSFVNGADIAVDGGWTIW